MKFYLSVAFLLSVVWALGMLGAGLFSLFYCVSDLNPVFLPYLIGSIVVWFGAYSLSRSMLRTSFNYGTTHGSAA